MAHRGIEDNLRDFLIEIGRASEEDAQAVVAQIQKYRDSPNVEISDVTDYIKRTIGTRAADAFDDTPFYLLTIILDYAEVLFHV